MQIFINNEEVVCSRNIVINKELANTDSIILNNVYPKSWEQDKDYVSRFYMPKDYSPVKIINENINTTTDYDLSNNIYYKSSRVVNAVQSKIIYYDYYTMFYIPVEKGKTYKLNITNSQSRTLYLYQCDSLDVNTQVIDLISVSIGTNDYQITPTKKYIVGTYSYGTTTLSYYSKINSIKLTAPDNLIFSGLIKNSGNINLNPREPHYATLQALDYKTLLSEGETLNYVLEKQTVSEAIKTVVDKLEGFMIGDIKLDSDEIIAPYNCNEKTPYDVLQYISEITGSRWFTKTITEKTVLINFYSPGNIPEAKNIEYNQEYFRENNIQDISYSYSSNNYRNKQVITNENATASLPQVETIVYEGGDIELAYNVANVESVKNGNTSYSVAESRTGQPAYFHYSYGSNSLSANDSIPTGTVLTITYYPIVSLREVAYNQTEIERIASTTNRNGIISRYEKRTDTNNAEALSQIAQSYIDYKSVPEITLKVRTYYKDILEIGTQVLFKGPLLDLSTVYLVKSKTIEMIVTGSQMKTFYTYELSSSFNDENAINFFDNQRRKLEGNIEEGEYIDRYIDIPSMTNIIFYGATIEPISSSVNTLDADLDMEV